MRAVEMRKIKSNRRMGCHQHPFTMVCCHSYECAIICNHYMCVRKLHKRQVPWGENVCTLAAKMGDLQIFKFAYESGAPVDGSACEAAAHENGNMHIARFMAERGLIQLGLRRGHLAPNRPVGTSASFTDIRHEKTEDNRCRFARDTGHLECLRYAHQRTQTSEEASRVLW